MVQPNFNEVQLYTTDFDITYALTSEPAPNGMTVALAYEKGVESLFGEFALARFRRDGLSNRAPAEIVMSVDPHSNAEAQRSKVEDLVQIKLDLITPQVGQRQPDGTMWPRLREGFRDLWLPVSDSKYVDTGVISSGHDEFILRFHEVHELPEPDILLTDDYMRPLLAHLPAELCMKPSRLLMDIVHHKWLQLRNVPLVHEAMEVSRGRIVYSGDDNNKDERTARDAGVRYVHIDPNNPHPGFSRLGRILLPRTFLASRDSLA
jgi:hypothetical protein